MDYRQNPVAAAVAAGIIKLSLDGAGIVAEWSSIDRRIKLFTGSAKGRSVLFLGSAISSLKPTHLPMWNQFVELIWLSLLKVGLKHQPASIGDFLKVRWSSLLTSKELFEEFKSFFDLTKGDVPNYLVTEIVSRRLGLQYLDLLGAFEAQRSQNDFDKSWALNNVHKWAARSLMTNESAAIVATNFDNYMEKALKALNAVFYQVTGDAHQDGAEISARLPLVFSNQKLVLIVNGPKAFAFIRSLMPQLGGGKITFLFKLHSSCYDPPSCIDTRLQRSQGLPSYSTDILDTLLVRSMWLVAGFSGSDMNDNLDYLRLVSNKNHARIVWLENPNSYREKSLGRLVEMLDHDTDSLTGLCLMNGYFVGERVSVSDEAPRFASKVLNWAESLGCDWCKLVAINLVTLFENKTSQQPRAELLQSLNHGEAPSQDWNLLLSKMNFSEQENQIRTCFPFPRL